MKTIGATQNASAAQIAIVWAMAKGTLPLIGATKIHHVTDAAQAAQLKLDANDIATPEKLAQAAQTAPIVNLFELGVQPGQTAVHDEVGRNNITASVNGKAGTLAMYSVKHEENPEMACMIEIHADDAAYQAHIQSPPCREFLRHSPDILASHKKRIALVPRFPGDKKVSQTPETIMNMVIVGVKPEHDQAFRDIVMPEMAESLKVEDGVLAIYASTEKDNPDRRHFHEIHASETAYQAHRQTPHFHDYLKQITPMLQGKQAMAITPALLMNKGGLWFSAP